MLLRLIPIMVVVFLMSGCASTQTKTQNEQMESRVSDLEKNLQAKDAEIVDLQYQVKDLSSKIDASKTADASQGTPASSAMADEGDSSKGPDMVSAAQIIRVKVSAEKVQRALKAAGVYTGPIDGKIGAGTKEAIIEFQKSHNLKADGILGRRSWEILKSYLK